MKINDYVRLTGKTQRGKARVLSFGQIWTVDSISTTHRGKEALLRAVACMDFRWVAIKDDKDFTVEILGVDKVE